MKIYVQSVGQSGKEDEQEIHLDNSVSNNGEKKAASYSQNIYFMEKSMNQLSCNQSKPNDDDLYINITNNSTTAASTSNNHNNTSHDQATQKRKKFSKAEDLVILNHVKNSGQKKWSEIAKLLPGRSELMIRNRYYVKIRQLAKQNCIGNKSNSQQNLTSSQTDTSLDNTTNEKYLEEQLQQQNFENLQQSQLSNDEGSNEGQDHCIIQNEHNPIHQQALSQDFFENEHIPEIQNEGENQQFFDYRIPGDIQMPHQLLAQEDDDNFFEEANMPFKMPELPSSNEFYQDYHQEIRDPVKHEKIQFLQNQITMIEDMLSTCKNEIIRELAFRNTPSSIPATADNSIQNIYLSPAVPLAHGNDFHTESQDPLAELEENNIPINSHMDIEVQASSFFHEDQDQFGYFFQHNKPFSPLDNLTNFEQF